MLKLRPHHLLCLISFRGMGYSPGFVRKMHKLQDAYLSGESIRIVSAADDVCAFCPHLNGDICEMPDGLDPERLDEITLEALCAKVGDVLCLSNVKKALSKLYETQWSKLCRGCTWREQAGCIGLLREYASQ